MRIPKHPIELVIKILSEVSLSDDSAEDVCHKHGISLNTFKKWKTRYRGLSSEDIQKLNNIIEENFNLKTILAEKELEIHLYREIIRKHAHDYL